MAKRKAKPSVPTLPSIETLAVEMNNILDHVRADASIMYARVKRPQKRTADPCAAEQSVYVAALAVSQQLFDATVIAAQISMIAQMELMACRMNNP